jgi:hypothetical protein
VPTLTRVMVLGEDVWPVVRALVRDSQAMLPAPDDEPESDDEPDDEPTPKPHDESNDESDDEPDDDPETLYFGEGRRMDGPILLKPNITASRPAELTPRTRRGRFLCTRARAPRLPRPVQRCAGASKACL